MHAIAMLFTLLVVSLSPPVFSAEKQPQIEVVTGVPRFTFNRGNTVARIRVLYYGNKWSLPSLMKEVCRLNPGRFKKCVEDEFQRIKIGWKLYFPPTTDRVIIKGKDIGNENPVQVVATTLVPRLDREGKPDGFRIGTTISLEEAVRPLVEELAGAEEVKKESARLETALAFLKERYAKLESLLAEEREAKRKIARVAEEDTNFLFAVVNRSLLLNGRGADRVPTTHQPVQVSSGLQFSFISTAHAAETGLKIRTLDSMDGSIFAESGWIAWTLVGFILFLVALGTYLYVRGDQRLRKDAENIRKAMEEAQERFRRKWVGK